MPLSADRKVSNIKRGFTIEGVIKFIDNRRRFNLSRISENNNEKLIEVARISRFWKYSIDVCCY